MRVVEEQISIPGRANTNGETDPHKDEGDGLPSSMQLPLLDQRHEHRPDGIENRKNERHDDTVRNQHPAIGISRSADDDATSVSGRSSGRTPSSSSTIRDTALRILKERVAVRTNGSPAGVDLECRCAIVLGESGTSARRRKRGAAPPSTNPSSRTRQGQLSVTPCDSVGTDHVGNHLPITRDTAAFKELQSCCIAAGVERRHRMPCAAPGRERDVAGPVLVHDEHVGPRHARTGT